MLHNLNKLKLLKLSQYFLYIFFCYRQKLFFSPAWLHRKGNCLPEQSREWDTAGQAGEAGPQCRTGVKQQCPLLTAMKKHTKVKMLRP